MRGLVAFASLALAACALVACSEKSTSNPGTTGGNAGTAGGAPSAGVAGVQPSSGASAAGGAGASASGAGGAGGGTTSVDHSADDAPNQTVTYTSSSGSILNPERGFFATTSLVDAPNLSKLRASGVTLVHSYVRLDDYRMSDLPPALLTQASAGFEQARQAGVKVILRFAYNFGPYPDSEPDAPKAMVLKHIGQLKPLLAANADVIAVVQAGFIGAWGEWHTSTNNLTDPATRKEILETLVDAVPASRSVQLRYPPYKHLLYGDALTAANAFGTSYAARIGHHNDCFVSSATDVGTYPDDMVDFYRDYVGADTAFVPMGGETCAVDAPRSECTSTIAEMSKLHFSYINREFQADVLASWQPCRDEIDQRLGYRLLLESALLPSAVKPGGSFSLTATLKNLGFAAPFNARPVFLVLRGNGVTARVLLSQADPRRWLTGTELKARVRLPSKLAAGKYALSLWLPDAAESLQGRSEYALHLANDDVWDAATGENLLGHLDVDVDAPGTAVTDAETFSLLSE